MTDYKVIKEMRALSNVIKRYIENEISNGNSDNITGTNRYIIAYIASRPDQDIFQKDLEREFAITRSTASKVIKLMEQKGLISRVGVDYDARLKKLVLTEEAIGTIESYKKQIDYLEISMLAGFSEEDIDRLSGYLRTMRINIMSISAETQQKD